MWWALNPAGERVRPQRSRERAQCPSCHATVVAKCGRIVAWHWAHEALTDCDTWAEPDSRWHHEWQALVPPAWTEVILGPHRADILAYDGTVIELQHSPISVDEIRAREAFYPKMGWIFDATEAYRTGRLELRRRASLGERYRTFRWRHARKSIAACTARVFLDLGDVGPDETPQPHLLLALHRIYPDAPTGGYGLLCTRDEVLATIVGSPR